MPTTTIPTLRNSMSAILAAGSPLIPVLHIEDADHAEPLLAALENAGITAIEVTLRSDAALSVIERMSRAAKSASVGAGTVTRPDQFARVRDAGAKFAVSPGLSPTLAEAAHASGLPYVPGVSTSSEVLFARECGFH